MVTPVAGTTPETYLGSARAKGFLVDPMPGTHDYESGVPVQDQFALQGTWKVTGEAATAVSGARLDAAVRARRVYLVLSSPGGPRSVKVSLDGRPTRVVTVRDQRLYELVDLKSPGRHRLSLRFDAGVSGFAFTFG